MKQNRNAQTSGTAQSRNVPQPEATDFEELQPKQWQVIECLVGGQTVAAAAESAGVNRTTVWRWQRTDFAFQAAYNRCRREAVAEINAQILSLAPRALKAVQQALETGDARVAILVLRGLGLLNGERPTIPSDDVKELKRARRQTEFASILASTNYPDFGID